MRARSARSLRVRAPSRAAECHSLYSRDFLRVSPRHDAWFCPDVTDFLLRVASYVRQGACVGNNDQYERRTVRSLRRTARGLARLRVLSLPWVPRASSRYYALACRLSSNGSADIVIMNSVPRVPKNPLLSAAGPSFPYENYAENTLLVPVTAATPAVLRDDAELDNFVGQELDNIQSEAASKTHEVDSTTNASSQPKESKDTANQPARQGYFTSILSSLPNLSLSSIKTDSSGLQINQSIENIAGAARESNPYISSQGCHNSQSEIPGFLAINQDSRSADLSGFAVLGPTGVPPNPSGSVQPAVPPSLPQAGDAPVSYRLGNQRRLKYAPPPDLTSSNAKPSPTIETFFPAQNVSVPPTILNPYGSQDSLQSNTSNVQQISFSPEQLPSSEQLSRNSSLHSSFRSSPVATGTAYDLPVTFAGQNPFYETSSVPTSLQFVSSLSRPIPSRVREPATPQNTPANVSFPGFVSYANQDLPPTSNLDKDLAASKSTNQLNSPPEFSKENSSGATVESAHKVPLILGKTGEAAFTPISAAKVTEKLEHLLAEQKESSPFEVASTEASLKVDEITSGGDTELEGSFEAQSETLQATNEAAAKSCETKIDDVQEEVAYSKSNTLSDVLLGQETVTQSITCPKIYTVDNNPVVTDIQATTKSIVSPPQQYYQFQSTSTTSSAGYANKPADQKSIYASDEFPQQSDFYSPPKTSEVPFASIYFESATNSSDQFRKFPSRESNANTLSVGQSTVDATSGTQILQENPVFTSSVTVDSTPFWSVDQSLSQSQPLNVAFGQPAYIAANQPPPPIFYNPADFANELPKQPTLSYSHDQRFAQQSTQQYQNQSLYEGTKEFQDLHVIGEINTAPFLTVVPIATVPEPTGSATLSPIQMSANSLTNRSTPDTVPASFQNLASGSSDKRMQYRVVYHHWFYRKEIETKTLWHPFSMRDSLKLEQVHNSSDITPETTVATDGGRFDVDILRRQRAPVYWLGSPTEVRRCSWFFKGATESRYVPYDESTAAKLEEEYKQACLTNNWNRRVELNNGEYVVFHSMTVQVHYLPPVSPEMAASWGNSSGSEDSTYLQGSTSKPKVVKRGVDEFNIDEGEPQKVDHLLFLVHGIGSVCDLKFRTVEEVVDEFRSISLQLVQSHYRTASEQGIVNRIEVLPISWHTTLHSDDTGIDKKLQAITLESIPKLRHFTNDTLLDILFYTSPVYCQTIMQTVGTEINKLHALFKDRNPTFSGEIYLGGHSLGSLILFDLLCHQKPPVVDEQEMEEKNSDENGENDNIRPIKRMPAAVLKRRLSKRVSYVMGAAGTGQPYIHYPQLNFHPRAFFALGSPIGMFVTVRGIDTLGENFAFPTCPAFFNIFHPFDPVAYRVESLINPEAYKVRPMLIPHHKGRKRMHLELKETMARVGADLKQKLLDSVRSTWNSVYQLALFHKQDNQVLELEIDKVVEEQLQKPPSMPDQHNNDDVGADLKIGKLNGGRRIDYVLQEAPFEYINEYIFALTAHICYWESEDTMLLILKEVYGSKGIQTDAQLPQQTMSIERVSSSSSSLNLATATSSPNKSNANTPSPVMGIDPTVPMMNKPIGPPPKTGFVRKS